MRRHKLSDTAWPISLFGGALFSPLLVGVVLPLLIQGKVYKVRWSLGYSLLLLSTLWALLVVAIRGIDSAGPLFLQYVYYWSLPFIVLLYGPTRYTELVIRRFIIVIFLLDFGWNLIALIQGVDLLGRQLDLRPGLVFDARYGGLFAHSFYSGSISIVAYIFLITGDKRRWLALLPVINLLMAGSWRLMIAIVLVPFFFWYSQRSSRIGQLIMTVILSGVAVAAVFLTSSFFSLGIEPSQSNDFRIYAWFEAISKILISPWFGFGYPSLPNDGMSEEVIDSLLIAESAYLNAALTFGIPYAFARFLGIFLILYGDTFNKRSKAAALIVPVVVCDFVYGGLLDGAVFGGIFWLLVTRKVNQVPIRNFATRQA